MVKSLRMANGPLHKPRPHLGAGPEDLGEGPSLQEIIETKTEPEATGQRGTSVLNLVRGHRRLILRRGGSTVTTPACRPAVRGPRGLEAHLGTELLLWPAPSGAQCQRLVPGSGSCQRIQLLSLKAGLATGRRSLAQSKTLLNASGTSTPHSVASPLDTLTLCPLLRPLGEEHTGPGGGKADVDPGHGMPCYVAQLVTLGAAGQNKQHSITKNTAKLDRETEELHHDRVTLEVGKVIQQGRQSKGLTQKDLATKINEKPQVIADYESGRAIPNNQVLGKIERAIGECPAGLRWPGTLTWVGLVRTGTGRPLGPGILQKFKKTLTRGRELALRDGEGARCRSRGCGRGPRNASGRRGAQWAAGLSGLKLRGKDVGKPIEKGPRAK
ncbi:hypothetical protein CB1_000059003 [Camelus ferus]|nr:hypothetical protein CB1_000059003 [Camelus ferus]